MDKPPLVLTLDFGTQSLRASLTNDKGEIENIEKFKYNPPYFSDSYAEQDADYYWNGALTVLKALCKKVPEKLDRIVGASITTFRDTSVQLDQNLKPIRRSILWLDQRLAKGKEKLPRLHWALFTLIGMKPTIVLNRARTVAQWLKENEPETWNKTYKYVNISTYLTYKLTGNLVDSSSSFVGHYPINYKARNWYKSTKSLKARFFGIPKRMLCDLKLPGEVLGVISDDIAEEVGLPKGIKLYATGSDKACETVGLGALSNEIGAISYGTASTIEVSNKKYYEPEPFLPAYGAAVPNWYNMEVQIYRGYWMLTWFAKEFASDIPVDAKGIVSKESILNTKLSSIPPGSNGLIVQPYWGPGLSRPLARGAVIGFSDIHTRDHLYRAIIEGIAYSLREGLEGIEKSQRHKIKELRISGGGSQSDDICQITADIFGLPVSRVQTFETTSLGAAIATFTALGEFESIDVAIKAMSHKSNTFIPDEETHKQYNFLYKKAYVQLYPHAKDIYKEIKKYNNKYAK